MPYKLRGNSVVKADSGEVVKSHPTRAKALAHLRALKANVEEGSPAVLGALLESFAEGKHPRGPHGRWIAALNAIDPSTREFRDVGGVAVRRGGVGGRLFITKRYLGKDRTPHETHHGSADEAARYIEGSQAGKPAPRSLPTSRRATLGKAEGDAAARTRAEILTKSPSAAADLARHQSIARGATDPHGGFGEGDHVTYKEPSIVNGKIEGHGPAQYGTVTGKQRNGYLRVREPVKGTTVDVHHKNLTKVGRLHPAYSRHFAAGDYARNTAKIANEKAQRAASPPSADHAKVRGYLENLPEGRYFHLAGLANAGALARRTAAGFEVYRGQQAKPDKVHKTPSAAAGHMMRIRNEGLMSSSSRERGLAQLDAERQAGRRTVRPRVRESAPVLGALLEGPIGHVEKGAFHRWLGKKEDEPITAADIERGLKAGGRPARMAAFAKAARKFGK